MKLEMNTLRKRDWSFILLILVVAAACIRLGFWQLARLEQRQAEIERIEERLNNPPVKVATTVIAPAFEYQPAFSMGQFDPQNQILLENQSLDGQPGFHLVTPLRFERVEGAILVDRGWIPFEPGINENLDQFEVSGIVEVTGVLTPSVNQPRWSFLADPAPEPGDSPLKSWRFLTVNLIQDQFEYPLAGLILVQNEPLEGGPALPRPDPRIELDEGPHLGYAIQWFLFATIAVVGGAFWVRRRLTKDHEST
jgi:surfeit locus 1 family protein